MKTEYTTNCDFLNEKLSKGFARGEMVVFGADHAVGIREMQRRHEMSKVLIIGADYGIEGTNVMIERLRKLAENSDPCIFNNMSMNDPHIGKYSTIDSLMVMPPLDTSDTFLEFERTKLRGADDKFHKNKPTTKTPIKLSPLMESLLRSIK